MIEILRSTLPDYAKDIKLNLSTVLSEGGAPGLSSRQILSTALGAAFASRSDIVTTAIEAEARAILSDDDILSIKASAAIMSMNNIYYRFSHLMEDKNYHTMPANLRMNVMANPPGDKLEFELSAMAISAINGCGKCMNAHALQLEKAGFSKQAVQSVVRIASVIYAAAIVGEIS